MRTKASVIIPTYDRAEPLSYTLRSLSQQDIEPTDFEVIVSDDGSTDRTTRTIREYGDLLNLRYVHHDDLGHRTAATRNAGAAHAASKLLIFLDSGTVASTAFVSAHLREHDTADSPLAVVGRVAGYDTGSAPPASLGADLATAGSLTSARVRQMGLTDKRDGEVARFAGDLEAALLPWRLFWTGNCSIPTDAFREVGGFDERFIGWGVEDVDLGYRLSRAGSRLKWSVEALAIEYPHERVASANAENNYRNHRLFLESHLDPEIELFIAARRSNVNVHDAAVEYRAWTADLPPFGPPSETRDISSFIGRHAVFGPVRRKYDDVLITPRTTDHGSWRRSIGLHTRLPPGIFAAAHISAFYRPIWSRWREEILAEARRVASHVTLDPELDAR